MPTKVIDLELTQPLTTLRDLEGCDDLHILVRQCHRPIGWVYLTPRNGVVSVDRLQQAIAEQLDGVLAAAAREQEFLGHLEDNAQSFQPISIILCAHRPTAEFDQGLESLINLDYPNFEVIVVDISPEGANVAQRVAGLPVRYLREPKLGMGQARNQGIAAAQFDRIAFVGEGVTVDRDWLRAIDRAFSDPEVMAVTGLVVADQITRLSHALSEAHVKQIRGLSAYKVRQTPLSLERLAQSVPLTERDQLNISQGICGRNMAFRRSLLEAIGLFDETLGAGTPTRGGDYLEIFYRLLSAGYTFAYEPGMIAWQTPRSFLPQLWQQVYSQGCGLGAFLMADLQRGTVSPLSVIRFVILDWLLWQILMPCIRPRRKARYLLLFEFAGMLISPLAYVFSQLRPQKRYKPMLEPSCLAGAASELEKAETQEATL